MATEVSAQSTSTTALNLAKCEMAARTVDFTPALFETMTGAAADEATLMVGARLSGTTYLLLLRTIDCDCSNTPVTCGLATLVGRSKTSDFDGEATIPTRLPIGTTPPILMTTVGIEATYEINMFAGWSGTVRGARITFTAREEGSSETENGVGFYPQELILPAPVGLPTNFATYTAIADDVVDCDGLTEKEKQWFELRKCFNDFDTCMAQADDAYDIAIDVCNDWSTTLLHVAGGVTVGTGLGCPGGGLGAAIGCVVGGVIGGAGGYFYCLRDARNDRRVAYADCANSLHGCLENWIIAPP
jgi:hypothetical protein